MVIDKDDKKYYNMDSAKWRTKNSMEALLMKMSKILSLVLAVIMIVTCFTACEKKEELDVNVDELVGTYDITLWVSEKDGVAALSQQQIEACEAKYEGIVINAQI